MRFGDRRGSLGALLLTIAVFLGLATPAFARDCADMKGERLAGGTITGAELVAAGQFKLPANALPPPPGVAPTSYANLPAFCRVTATLTPSPDSDIRMEVWLPAQGWNGRFVGIGNGIWAGSISYAEMGETVAKGYAAASTDTGHVGNGMDAEFAVGHPEKLSDFGYRAVHEMTVAGKALTTAFYGRKPAFAFWNSCSTGGRQGLMEAYRYPDDYDAISSMAPANPMTELMVQTVWTGYQPLRTPESRLPPPTLAALHQAWLKACDAGDGLADGQVADPGACRFDPAMLACAGAAQPTCLTTAQVATMRAIYGGVTLADGKQILPGFPGGSEMQLAFLTQAPEPFPVATSYMRLLVFGDPKWDFRTFDYRRDTARARDAWGKVLDVPAAGIAPFLARGHKLLLSHGWSDGLIPATNILRFHGEVERQVPAADRNRNLRLFMVPGMDHCGGGEGPFKFDTLAVIDSWATTGAAPERIVASRPEGTPPLSRPLCPFPKVARYKGQGDTKDAASFTCTA